MNRRAEKSLLSWKDSNHRKPLLLLGARQVGKTWLMNEFGRKYFEKVLYIRFDRNEQMRQLFERSSYDMNELLLLLQAAARFKIEPGKTLIILDEIQECPAALTSLKYLRGFAGVPRDGRRLASGSTPTPGHRFPGGEGSHSPPVSHELSGVFGCTGLWV